MTKRYNPNKCKSNRNYTMNEIALLYDVHKNTVKAWLKKGLKKIDNQRPYLILGRDLRQFLKDLRSINKRPCELGEIFCMKCRTAREPEQGTTIFEHQSIKYGRLKGVCNVCQTPMNKYIRLEDIGLLQQHLSVISPLQQKGLD